MRTLFGIAFYMITISLVFFTSTMNARADQKPILPLTYSYSDGIDNLPKWDRIINFYEMTNLQSPSAEYVEWWKFIRSLKSMHPAKQIEIVNQEINKYPYKQDNWIYNRTDHWASPSEFLENGGDCEDFAIIKYMTLRRLGFRADQMKIAMVYDIYSGTDHSYLIVEYGKQTFVLDSREQQTSPDVFTKRFQAHYAFNENGIWRYKSPKIVLKSRQGDGRDVLPGNR